MAIPTTQRRRMSEMPSRRGNVDFRPRLCENTLGAFKTAFCLCCLCNQQAEARITSSSNIGSRNAVWAASAAQTATHGRSNGWTHALIASSSPAMPKMLIIRLRL